MLDIWIIEEILRRERPRREERPMLEMPMVDVPDEAEHEVRKEDPERGVVVIDYSV